MNCTDVCPHEPYLLLAGSDELLAMVERGLQREPVGDRREDLGNVRRRKLIRIIAVDSAPIPTRSVCCLSRFTLDLPK